MAVGQARPPPGGKAVSALSPVSFSARPAHTRVPRHRSHTTHTHTHKTLRYNTPKYRLVVRFSTRDITAQIVHATLAGDVILCAAYAHELPRYGLTVGLTNYAAAYATGLLVARRALTVLGLADTYTGAEEATGEDFTVEEVDGAPRPFTVLLDTGLKRTSTGSKVFATLKGALDGGLDVPHSEKRFVGYDAAEKALDAETLQKYVLGGHVGEYMEELAEEDPERYQAQFARFVQAGVGPDDLEALYRKVHAAIRADPAPQKKARSKPAGGGGAQKAWKATKSTYEERKARLKAKLADLGAVGV